MREESIVLCILVSVLAGVQARVWDKETIYFRTHGLERIHGEVKKLRPLTPKQLAWWENLGRRESKENQANVKIRKELRLLTTEEFRRYTTAVNVANRIQIDPDDDRSLYQLLVSAHPLVAAPAAHLGAALLPWHREFLWRVERALQSIDPSVTLPFWDSVMDSVLPRPLDTVVFSSDLLGTNVGQVLDGPYANFSVFAECQQGQPHETIWRSTQNLPTNVQKDFLWTEDEIDFFLNHTMFQDFAYNGSWFERQFHDKVHLFTGGTQLNVDCSPSDPWFFTHHTHLDMIWELFRQNSQVTPIDTEYPSSEDGIFVGQGHEPFDQMNPYNIYNIQGIATHYTDYYYQYAPRDYTSCVTSEDCASPYLWCEMTSQSCWSKIREGGVCTGLTDEACYGENMQCIGDECVAETRKGKQ